MIVPVIHQITLLKLNQKTKDKYNPITINNPLKNIIINHKDLCPENIDLIDNEGNGN